MRKEPSPLLMILTLSPLQGFSSGETDFYLCQFLSNFLRYSFSNLLSSHSYSNFAVYLPSNSLLLNSLSSTISILSCLLTSAFICPLNFFNAFFVFSKFSLFSHVFCSTVNPFHHTGYLFTPLIFLFFPPLTLQLPLFQLVFPLPFSALPLVPCIVLSN